MSDINNDKVEAWIIQWLSKELEIETADIDPEEEFVNLGVGSRQAVFLTGDLEDWLDIELDPSMAWEHPTIRSMASHLLTLVTAKSDKA